MNLISLSKRKVNGSRRDRYMKELRHRRRSKLMVAADTINALLFPHSGVPRVSVSTEHLLPSSELMYSSEEAQRQIAQWRAQ